MGGVAGARYEYFDHDVGIGHTDAYRLEAVGRDGSVQHFDLQPVAFGGIRMARLMLQPPRPNPFTPPATIHFELPRSGRVALIIHDVSGRRVRSIIDQNLAAGAHTITWNDRDDRGREVGSGVYFVRLDARSETASARVLLMR